MGTTDLRNLTDIVWTSNPISKYKIKYDNSRV